MKRRLIAMAALGLSIALALPTPSFAQTKVLSSAPPNLEFQYQLYYPRVWGWPGPGMSLGGSLPSKGREGISSFYGRPLPAPLGSGVFMNPYAYATQLPGPPLAYGLASSTQPTGPANTMQFDQPGTQVAGGGGGGINPAAMMNPMSGQSSVPMTSPTLQPPRTQTALPPVPASSPASLQRSAEMEAIGNDHFAQRNWGQAHVNFRNAVMTAPDRAEGHLRLGYVSLVLGRFPEAAQEFKRALTLDREVANHGETLETVYGPDSTSLRADIVRTVATWSSEDIKDQDRLFLLGFVLRNNNDIRSQEILAAALQIPGPSDHLLALTTPASYSKLHVYAGNDPNSTPAKLPALHDQPIALQ